MKVLLISLFALSTMSLALAGNPSCPKGINEVIRCEASPAAGNSEVAVGLVDKVVVCTESISNQYALLLTSPGSSAAEAAPVEKTSTRYGTTFGFNAKGTAFSLNIGMNPSPVTGTFSIKLPNNEIHSVNVKCN